MTNFWFSVNSVVTSGAGDWSSVVGLVVAVVGFAVTIVGVSKSKSAAQKAKEAALAVRDYMRRTDTVAEVAAAISALTEIKSLQRHCAWELLPDRYSSLRKALISVRTANPSLAENHLKVLQSAIQMSSSIEKMIEEALTTQTPEVNISRLNTIVSRQIDKLQELLVQIKENT